MGDVSIYHFHKRVKVLANHFYKRMLNTMRAYFYFPALGLKSLQLYQHTTVNLGKTLVKSPALVVQLFFDWCANTALLSSGSEYGMYNRNATESAII
jgi:hypothetical protein